MKGFHRAPACALCLAAALTVSAPLTADDTIARWVDEDGNTHFGNLQFAPRNATRVSMAPVNVMDVPEEAPPSTGTRGPVWTVIDRQPRQNKIGWRSKGEGPNRGHISPSQR